MNIYVLCILSPTMQVMLTTRDWDALPSYSTPGKALQAQQQAQAQTLQRQQLQQQQQAQAQQQQLEQGHNSSSDNSDPAAKCPFPHSWKGGGQNYDLYWVYTTRIMYSYIYMIIYFTLIYVYVC